jgi:hypothetical protein
MSAVGEGRHKQRIFLKWAGQSPEAQTKSERLMGPFPHNPERSRFPLLLGHQPNFKNRVAPGL